MVWCPVPPGLASLYHIYRIARERIRTQGAKTISPIVIYTKIQERWFTTLNSKGRHLIVLHTAKVGPPMRLAEEFASGCRLAWRMLALFTLCTSHSLVLKRNRAEKEVWKRTVVHYSIWNTLPLHHPSHLLFLSHFWIQRVEERGVIGTCSR